LLIVAQRLCIQQLARLESSPMDLFFGSHSTTRQLTSTTVTMTQAVMDITRFILDMEMLTHRATEGRIKSLGQT
jgi:hypothetical protein